MNMSGRRLLTPCPPPNYVNPYIRPVGNIYTEQIDYFLTKEYIDQVVSHPAFKTSQAAIGKLLEERLNELTTECYCPFIIEVAKAVRQNPLLGINLLKTIEYKGAWKVHYHLVLEVIFLITAYTLYFRNDDNPEEDYSKYLDKPNQNNIYSLSDRKMAMAEHMYMDEVGDDFSDLKGITKAKAIVARKKEFFKEETPINKQWLQEKGLL